jgi:membrane protease YdiL (CAAX protease family)
VKIAVFCFAAILLAEIAVAIILSAVSVPAFAVSIILYACFLGVFFLFYYLAKDNPNTAPTRDNFNVPQIKNILIVAAIAFVSIGAYLLFQTACIDFFNFIGIKTDTTPFVIKNWGEYIIYIFTMCVLPAVIEELVFRGVIYKSLSNDRILSKQVLAYIVLAAAFFAVYHLSFSQLVYQFIIGVIFCFMFYKTGNLIYGMIAHFINNFFIITYTFIAGSDYIPYTWNWYTILLAVLYFGIGSAIIYFLLRFLKKQRHEKQQG